jgi:hypothetical protein
MSHLSPDDFVDAADGTLRADRAAHLESCVRCREQAATVRSAIDAARIVEVPEPSPLYWPHLAARVRERIAGETIAPAWRTAGWWHVSGIRQLVPVASVAALLAAVVVTELATRDGRGTASFPAPVSVGAPAAEVGVVAEDSEAWQMLTSAAAETPIEDAHAAGMAVPAGAIDLAVQRMSPDELNALGKLLQSELRRSGD